MRILASALIFLGWVSFAMAGDDGFEAIAGTLSDRKPLAPEWRLEGAVASLATGAWVRLRTFEGPRDGERLTFLRARTTEPPASRSAEDLLADKDGKLLRYHASVEVEGERRETTIERKATGWRFQLFAKGEKKLDTAAPLDEEPLVPGYLVLLHAVSTLELKEGESVKKKLRFVDLDAMKVRDAVEWTIRREKNPITGAADPRAEAGYFVAQSADPAERLAVWCAGREPRGFEREAGAAGSPRGGRLVLWRLPDSRHDAAPCSPR